MKKFVPALGAATMALALGAAAYAAPSAMRHGPDANGDGTLTRAEVSAQVAERFAKSDANGDGVLNEADKAARMGQMFDKIDTDKNGSISRAEFTAAHSGMGGAGHEGMDHATMGGSGMGDRKMDGHKMGGSGPGMGGQSMGMGRGGAGMMLRMADANNDGAVTRDEAMSAALKHFDTMDANKDGEVTKAERQAAMKAMMGARMHGNGGAMMPPLPGDEDQ